MFCHLPWGKSSVKTTGVLSSRLHIITFLTLTKDQVELCRTEMTFLRDRTDQNLRDRCDLRLI